MKTSTVCSISIIKKASKKRRVVTLVTTLAMIFALFCVHQATAKQGRGAVIDVFVSGASNFFVVNSLLEIDCGNKLRTARDTSRN